MIQAVEHSAVPVIRLSTAQIPISFGNQGSLINVDITFDTFSHRGVRSVLVREMMLQYSPLKPLALVLKQYLVEKGLNDPFVGGLTSYGLVIMIVSILQKHFPHGIPADKRVLGTAFVLFLREFAQFGVAQRGVWIYTAEHSTDVERAAAAEECCRVIADMERTVKSPLYILDPLDRRNNIGRTCFGVHQVIQAFAEALEAIQLSPVRPDADNPGGPPSTWSTLGSVFLTGHHRHVVTLVTQVWCPRENPVPSKPTITVDQWAASAKSVLETLDHKLRICPWCGHRPHTSTCTIKSLLGTFPSLNL